MGDLNSEKYWSKVWSKNYYDDRKDVIKSMSDRANTASYWDNLWSSPKRRTEKYSAQRAIWEVQKQGAKSVLDVGSGNGRLLFGIKLVVPDCILFGIDISEVGVKKAKEQYGIDGMVMDVYDLDKLDRTFDCVVINHTLEHLYRDGEVIQKCFDRLNPGGTIFTAVPNNMSGPEETEEHVRKYNQESLTALINGVFGNCKIEIIGNHLIGIGKKL